MIGIYHSVDLFNRCRIGKRYLVDCEEMGHIEFDFEGDIGRNMFEFFVRMGVYARFVREE